MKTHFPRSAMFLAAALAGLPCTAIAAGAKSTPDSAEAEIHALKAQLAALEARIPAPELGRQMLELQIRHNRLWWAADAGNWNLAYFMVSELAEAMRDIEATNGDAAELQPQMLSDVMPAMMNPAVRGVQDALAKQDRAQFAKAYDRLSASCNACHKVAGSEFLVITRPKTPLLDNLDYAPQPASE